MIGIMNCGDESVEFYASARQSSLYANRVKKPSRTYTPDGRVFIDGVPTHTECAEKMWQDTISKMMAMRLMKTMDEQPTKTMAAIRRLSTKLRLTKTLSNPLDETILMKELHEEVRSGRSTIREHTKLGHQPSVRFEDELPASPHEAPPLPSSPVPLAPPSSLYITQIVVEPEEIVNNVNNKRPSYYGSEGSLHLSERDRQTDSGRESMRSRESSDTLTEVTGGQVTVVRF